MTGYHQIIRNCRNHTMTVSMETFSALLAFCQGNSPITGHKGRWRGVLMFSLICAGTNGWAIHRIVIWNVTALIMTSLKSAFTKFYYNKWRHQEPTDWYGCKQLNLFWWEFAEFWFGLYLRVYLIMIHCGRLKPYNVKTLHFPVLQVLRHTHDWTYLQIIQVTSHCTFVHE